MSSPLLKYFPDQVIDKSLELCGQFVDKRCCDKFIQDLDLQDAECIKMFSAKLVGYFIVIGASAVKIPQVLKLLGAKSGAGITVYGVLLELLAITFNACYSFRNNFPFSAWGEAVFLGIETVLIAFLVLWYDSYKGKALSFLLIYSGIVLSLLHPTLVSSNIMWWLQSTVLPLAVTGKMFQAIKNYKAQHTGQISAFTAWAIFGGSLTRILTTIQETGDMLTAVTFACAAAANAILALQVLYYWKSTQKFIEKGKKKKAN